MNTQVFKGDLSDEAKKTILNNSIISVDTETNGLKPLTDDLLIIQIKAGKEFYIIQFIKDVKPSNLITVLKEEKIKKIFHHAMFDVRFLMKHLQLDSLKNIGCTKIAAKLLYGETQKNSLRELVKKHLGLTLDKGERMSDWSLEILSPEQIQYAINDVKYLEDLWYRLDSELIGKNLKNIADECYDFISTASIIENMGIENIFKY